MQSASLTQRLQPWTQVEVIGIPQDDLCLYVLAELRHVDGLHGADRTDGHEDRRKDLSVVCLDAASSC